MHVYTTPLHALTRFDSFRTRDAYNQPIFYKTSFPLKFISLLISWS